MAGLASWIAKRTGDEYFAGVWRRHVFQDLLWRAYPREEDPQYGARTHYCSRKYIPDHIGNSEVCDRFCNALAEPTSGSPFGAIRSGWLKVEALLLKLEDSQHGMSVPDRTAVQYSYGAEIQTGYAAFDLQPQFPSFALFITGE
ncbi:hypothetical protein VUR80DRAFT_7342 [Thermomyces stellatus]